MGSQTVASSSVLNIAPSVDSYTDLLSTSDDFLAASSNIEDSTSVYDDYQETL